jgi:hypothetical protein
VAAAERVQTHRRYVFLKYHQARNTGQGDPSAWDTKRRALAGTALPANFPAAATLAGAGYLVLEEVTGADLEELTNAGLSSAQAAAVLAALE